MLTVIKLCSHHTHTRTTHTHTYTHTHTHTHYTHIRTTHTHSDACTCSSLCLYVLWKDICYCGEYPVLLDGLDQLLVADGAALVYTSTKEGKNCDILHQYLIHTAYRLPFRTPASIMERDAVFMYVFVLR